MALGSRALDILIVLTERPGEVVGAKELIARAWRGLVVHPGNLRVHVTGLRKVLGDGQDAGPCIINVPGQGYCFAAPVERSVPAGPAPDAGCRCGTATKRLVPPPAPSRMVGRAETVHRIADRVIADRFVTLIGPGGIGKTTVAASVAHAMREELAYGVSFVDLAMVADPARVAAAVASALGPTVQADDVVPTLTAWPESSRVLLVLDNCEHVIDAVAALAERIFRETRSVHLLATSREALRVEGERAYWLPPLAIPPRGTRLTAADARRFSSVQLFVERASVAGGQFELTDANAPAVAGICARLDGMALAIELAARRVASHGIAETAGLLAGGRGLDWYGRRTAVPRHRTLRALLDWSWGTLDGSERLVLRRASIFGGVFTLDAIRTVCRGSASDQDVLVAFDRLVAKCLVSASVYEDDVTRYRLLGTTRMYALEKLEESGDREPAARLHAAYPAPLLEEACGAGADSPERDPPNPPRAPPGRRVRLEPVRLSAAPVTKPGPR